MDDDLLEELNNILKCDMKKEPVNKLQSYFGSDLDKDDLFESIVHDDRFDNIGDRSNLNSQKCGTIDCKVDEDRNSLSCSDGKILENQYPLSTNNTLGDAWLNSEHTKSVLAKIISKDMNSNQVSKSILARPQLYTDPNQRLHDPILTLLTENYSYDTAVDVRQIPVIDDCKFNEKEVLSLIDKGWIRPAIDLTSQILYKKGFTFSKLHSVETSSTQFTLEIGRLWCLRFALLARMKLITILESELSGFQDLDCPNLYKEFYSESGIVLNKGSLIPFSMRLIYAEFPLFFNKFSEALNRLYYILAVIKRIIFNLESGYTEDGTSQCTEEILKNNALMIWQKRRTRVLACCMRVLIASKDYPSVIDIINDLIFKSERDIVKCFSSEMLYHLLARIYLQLGDVDNAGFYFEKSLGALSEYLEKKSAEEPIDKDCLIKTRSAFQNGLLNISRGNFEESKRCFQNCLEMNPTSYLILNNYAVCCLYLKQVQEAICIYEKMIQNGIRNDGIIFNLCILYELQTNQVKNKKLKIVKMLAKFPGDDFNIASFKLSNVE